MRLGDIARCAEVYNELLGKDVLIRLENGTSLKLRFLEENFTHLLGLHYLSDLDYFPANRKRQAFSLIRAGKITQAKLERSVFYSKIEQRVEMFERLPLFFLPGKCELIIDFDPSKVKSYSNISADYILFIKEADMYLHLPLRYNEKRDILFPQSFFPRRNKQYIDRQRIYRIHEINVVPYKEKPK